MATIWLAKEKQQIKNSYAKIKTDYFMVNINDPYKSIN